MKQFVIELFVILGLVSLKSMAQVTLTICHTNDTHSTILPMDTSLANKERAGWGGFVRRIALLQRERTTDPDLLYFDSGDFSQGSPYYSFFKGEVEVGLMNRMRVDATTIGNHEFDFGLDNLARLLKMANFPVISSNYDFSGTVLKDMVKQYVVMERKDVRIGVFALDPKLEGLVSSRDCKDVVYLDPVVIANKMTDVLKNKEHCDFIILLSHLGWQKPSDNADLLRDNKLIPQTRGIDLVLGGHSHTFFHCQRYVIDREGHSVPVVQEGEKGTVVGKIQVKLER